MSEIKAPVDTTITLPWAEKIRARLKESIKINGSIKSRYEEFGFIMDFIKPILEYADAEEKRITKEMVSR